MFLTQSEDRKMTLLQQAIASINFDEDNKFGGEYGLHDGFFNALVTVDGVSYYFQGCADNDIFDATDCGHDSGICGDVNEPLAAKLAEYYENDISIGYECVQKILTEAYILVNE